MLELARVIVLDPGDVDVQVAERGGAEFLGDLAEHPLELGERIDPPFAGIDMREIQAGLETVDVPAELENLVEGAELGPLAHRLDPHRDRDPFRPDDGHELGEACANRAVGGFGRPLAVETRMEDDAPRAHGRRQPGGLQQPFLAEEPRRPLLGVQVDVVGSVNAQADTQTPGSLADRPGRLRSHFDAFDELDLQAAQAELPDVLDRAQGRVV
jgi:hypothetical protein